MTDLPSAPMHAIVRPPETITQSMHLARILWLRTLFGQTFDDYDEDANPIESLAHRMTEFYIPRGALLYEQGSSSGALYFVVEGAVRQGTQGYTLFVPGDVLGFIDAMIDRPHRYTATVERDAVILRLRTDDWLEYLEDRFDALKGSIESSIRNLGKRPDPRHEPGELSNALLAMGQQIGSSSGEFVRRLLALRNCGLLARANIQALAQLVGSAKTEELSEGSERRLHRVPGLWVVVRGRVGFSAGGGETVLTYGPGSMLYSVTTLLTLPEEHCLVATENAELLYISTHDLFDVMEDHFDVARSVLAYLAQCSDELNQRRAQQSPRDDPLPRGKRSLHIDR